MLEVIIALIVLAAAGTFGAAWFTGDGSRQKRALPDPEPVDDVPEMELPKSVAPTPEWKDEDADSDVPDSEKQAEEYEIRARINGDYHTIEDISEETLELLETLNEALPKLPNATLDLMPVLAKPGAGAKEIAAIIERDQSTAARMLRWVNSSFYGLEGKVKSLQRAVTILGIDTVRSVVLEDAFSRGVKFRGLPGLSPHTVWRHAAAASITAKHLARHVRGVEPDVAATAGLLHDIGILLLLILERQNLKGILEVSRDFRESIIENEFDFLGFNHQVWGECFVRAWHLPDEIAAAIGRHHCPMKEPFDRLAAVVWLANYMVSRIGFACPQDQVAIISDEDVEPLTSMLGIRTPVERYITEGMVREIVSATSCWHTSEFTPTSADAEAAVE
jgi:HD-like signal output (HDOD) protein